MDCSLSAAYFRNARPVHYRALYIQERQLKKKRPSSIPLHPSLFLNPWKIKVSFYRSCAGLIRACCVHLSYLVMYSSRRSVFFFSTQFLDTPRTSSVIYYIDACSKTCCASSRHNNFKQKNFPLSFHFDERVGWTDLIHLFVFASFSWNSVSTDI